MASMSSSVGGTTTSVWHEEIVAAFQLRLGRPAGGYEVVAFNIDEEYLRYFDRVLEEMSVDDRRLPHRAIPIARSYALRPPR